MTHPHVEFCVTLEMEIRSNPGPLSESIPNFGGTDKVLANFPLNSTAVEVPAVLKFP